MNYVGSRDWKQSAWANQGDPSCKENLDAITIVDEVNTKGPNIIKYVESGGQMGNEYSKTGEDRTSFELDVKYKEAAPNGTKSRKLKRVGFGNGTTNVNIEDYQKHETHAYDLVGDAIVPKLFSYLYDAPETRIFTEATKRAGFSEVELAAPIATTASFIPFFAKKFPELTQIAQEYDCSQSLKIMSPHMDLKTGEEIFNIAAQTAVSHGVEELGAHIHLPSIELVAAFLRINKEHGLRSNVDFAYQGNGYFSGWQDVLEAADQAGIAVQITPEQEALFKDLDIVAAQEHKKYQGIIVPEAFSKQEYQDYGIPGGGAVDSILAVGRSSYAKIKGVDSEDSRRIFLGVYSDADKSSGEPPKVTPGHKRTETSAIHAADKNLNEDNIADLRDEKGDIDIAKVKEFFANLTCEEKFSKLDPKIIDALRGDNAPEKLSPEMKKFVCEEHMRNFLKQEGEEIPQDVQDRLVQASTNKEEVKNIAHSSGVDSSLIEKLEDNAGQRLYTESSSAKPRYQKALKDIQDLNKRGAKIKDVEEKALDTAALHGGDNERLEYAGIRPDPAGMSIAQFTAAKMEFYSKKKDIKEPGQEYSVNKEALKQAATDGHVSGGSILSEIYATSNDNKPATKVNATGADTVVDQEVQR